MRLGDIDAVTEKLLHDSFCSWHDFNTVMHALDNAPTVDAVPVKHGRWKLVKAGGQGYPFWDSVCSICDWKTSRVGVCDHYRFCPNCGAKMDEESNGR